MSKIVDSELVFYATTNGIGGDITANAIPKTGLNSVFGIVSAEEALTGKVEHVCIYIKNRNLTNALQNASMFLTANTASTDTEVYVGIGSSAINGIEQLLSNSATAPLNVTFNNALNVDTSLGGDIPAEGYKAIWLRRIISPNAQAVKLDGFSLTIQGKTSG